MGYSKYDLVFSENDKKQIKEDYIYNHLSIKDIMLKYGIKSKYYIAKLLNGIIRNYSEANKIAHQKYPEKYLHNEETKNKIREARLKFMKEHPEQTAWRLKNKSYLENMFEIFLQERGYADKYLIQREYSIFPYFIDFAFVDLKIAIEIDGSQHLLEDRLERDKKKDMLLQEQGWKVIRIAENVIKTDWDKIQEILNSFITLNTNVIFQQVGIVKAPHTREFVQRDEFGRSKKMNDAAIKQRRQIRPTAEELVNEIVSSNFKQVGKKYGVSDNTIRKWCLFYGLSNKSKEYKKMKRDIV